MHRKAPRSTRAARSLVLAWLVFAGNLGARAQAPPTPAPGLPPPAQAPAMSVEARLQKMEAVNAQLLEQNKALSDSLKAIQAKLDVPKTAAPPADRAGTSASNSAGANAEARGTSVSTGSTGGGAGSPAGADAPGSGPKKWKPTMDDLGNVKVGESPTMTGKFGPGTPSNGLWFSSPDKDFQVHIGGRTQFDISAFHANNQVQFGPGGIGRLRDGVDFRRARLRVEGTMYEQFQWIAEFDFVNSSSFPGQKLVGGLPAQNNVFAVPAPTDLWFRFRDVPIIGNLRVGNQKEPYGFERLTSSRFLTFMERSFNQDTFYGTFNNGFVPGVMAFDTFLDDRATWAAGVFKNTTNVYAFDVNGGNYAAVGRLTWLPIYEDNGLELVHLGITGRNSGLDNGKVRYRTRGPERAGLSGEWPLYANIPNITGNGGQQDVNFELASVLGPLSLQAEYNLNFVQQAFLPGQPSVGTLMYQGGYVELAYFLTGEHRDYDKKSAVFDRVVPGQNGYLVRKKDGTYESGRGAWQAAIRYNYLDLNDKGINGGVLNDLTLGLNWFLNPNTKVQWNYSYTHRQSGNGLSDGVIQGFGMRLAHDF